MEIILATETAFHKVNLKFCSFMSINVNFTDKCKVSEEN